MWVYGLPTISYHCDSIVPALHRKQGGESPPELSPPCFTTISRSETLIFQRALFLSA